MKYIRITILTDTKFILACTNVIIVTNIMKYSALNTRWLCVSLSLELVKAAMNQNCSLHHLVASQAGFLLWTKYFLFIILNWI